MKTRYNQQQTQIYNLEAENQLLNQNYADCQQEIKRLRESERFMKEEIRKNVKKIEQRDEEIQILRNLTDHLKQKNENLRHASTKPKDSAKYSATPSNEESRESPSANKKKGKRKPE